MVREDLVGKILGMGNDRDRVLTCKRVLTLRDFRI